MNKLFGTKRLFNLFYLFYYTSIAYSQRVPILVLGGVILKMSNEVTKPFSGRIGNKLLHCVPGCLPFSYKHLCY